MSWNEKERNEVQIGLVFQQIYSNKAGSSMKHVAILTYSLHAALMNYSVYFEHRLVNTDQSLCVSHTSCVGRNCCSRVEKF